MQDTKRLIAYAAGRDAAERGASRAPCHSKAVMELLKGNKVGEGLPVLKAFEQGYFDVCSERAAALV